jgi:hypothetical protein
MLSFNFKVSFQVLLKSLEVTYRRFFKLEETKIKTFTIKVFYFVLVLVIKLEPILILFIRVCVMSILAGTKMLYESKKLIIISVYFQEVWNINLYVAFISLFIEKFQLHNEELSKRNQH